MGTPEAPRGSGGPVPGGEDPSASPDLLRWAPGQRPLVRLYARSALMVVLLTSAYYALPDQSPLRDGVGSLRLAAVLVAGVLVAGVVRAQLRERRRMQGPITAIEVLLTALYMGVLAFAETYYRIASNNSDQFSGLETKTDGLYFTVTLVSTVGFGDVHASGTAARAIVTAQMLFNLLFIGTFVRLLSSVGPKLRRPNETDQRSEHSRW